MKIEDKFPDTYMHEKVIELGGVTLSLKMSRKNEMPTLQDIFSAYHDLVIGLYPKKTAAARVLGVNRRTIYRRLKRPYDTRGRITLNTPEART